MTKLLIAVLITIFSLTGPALTQGNDCETTTTRIEQYAVKYKMKLTKVEGADAQAVIADFNSYPPVTDHKGDGVIVIDNGVAALLFVVQGDCMVAKTGVTKAPVLLEHIKGVIEKGRT